MNDTHYELRDLITRVVIGDGNQRENIEMSDEEWMTYFNKHDGNTITIEIYIEDWMEMVRVARTSAR